MYERDYIEWSDEDIAFLVDMWGELSPNKIAKELQRRPTAVRRQAEKLKLTTKTAGYLIPSEVGRMLNREAETIRYWITNSGLKAVKKKYLRRNSYLIDPKDLKEFLIANPEKWKAIDMKENDLFIDEVWLANKRAEEMKTPNDSKLWSITEEQTLLDYINEGKTNREISELMGRTYNSIRRKRTNLLRSMMEDEEYCFN